MRHNLYLNRVQTLSLTAVRPHKITATEKKLLHTNQALSVFYSAYFVNYRKIKIMARIKNGILGGFSGKVGNVVGYQLGEECHMRALPVRHAPYTKNELLNMEKFKMVQDHLRPLKDFLKVGFKNYGTKTGGYRSAVSYTRKNALVSDETGFRIDPALLRVSGGSLPQAVNPEVTFEVSGHITFKWDTSDVTYEYESDQVMLLLYDVAGKFAESYVFNGAFRGTGMQVTKIPSMFKGKETDVYMGFIAGDRSSQSDSQYLGRMMMP